MSNISNEISRLRNRHVARLLNSIEGTGLAPVVVDAIKREFTFLANDIADLLCAEEGNTSHEQHNT